MDPHLRAILLAFVAAGVSGAALLLLIAAIARRRARRSAVPIPWIAATALVGVVAAASGYLLMVFLGMTINGESHSREVVEVDGVLRRIERRAMWGRSGLCLEWDERHVLDRDDSGFYADGRKVGALAFEADGVGFRDEDGKRGPWLFLGPDGAPDAIRSGWYDEDQPVRVQQPQLFGLDIAAGPIRPLDRDDLGDLRLAWESR